MKLGGRGGKSSSLLAQMKQEGAYSESDAVAPLTTLDAPVDDTPKMGVHVVLEETVALVMERDGGVQSMEIKGSISLVVNDAASARLRVATDVSRAAKFKFTTHPHINKALFSKQNMIGLKDPAKPFPTSGTPLQVLRWKRVFDSEDDVPLVVTCWPSSDTVSVQYELTDTSLSLSNVMIAIPIPGGSAPSVEQASGSYTFTGDALIWSLPIIDGDNASDTLEFSAAGLADELYFPVHVAFTAPAPLSGVAITDVVAADSGAPLGHSTQVEVKTGNYQIIDA